jgi:NAD(P)-dependent dehydrogenase (short-subunit alcohol dehydrogenase family)
MLLRPERHIPPNFKYLSMSQKYLVTGTSRGIGLALVRQLLSDGHHVIASARQPQESVALKELEIIHREAITLAQIDVNSDESVEGCAAILRDLFGSIDVLINNAGLFPEEGDETLAEMTPQLFRNAFETNVLGPFRMVRAFLPMLQGAENPRIVNISSGAGSISEKEDFSYYAYSTSKAALNMLTRAMASELKPKGICVVALSPGWVKTDMGGPNAQITPEQSAAAIAKTVSRLKLDRTSTFMGRDGNTDDYPW